MKKDVEKACFGDQHAFERLIAKAENKMYRIARTILRQDADCADATQEALFRAWKSLPGLRDKSLFEPWLMRILVRECYRLIGRNKQLETFVPEIHEPQGNWEFGVDMRRALDRLPVHERMVLMLHYTLDYSIKDVASILKIPAGTVKSRLYRGREHMARIWKEINEWNEI